MELDILELGILLVLFTDRGHNFSGPILIAILECLLQILVGSKADGVGKADIFFLADLLGDLLLQQFNPDINLGLFQLCSGLIIGHQAHCHPQAGDKQHGQHHFHGNVQSHSKSPRGHNRIRLNDASDHSRSLLHRYSVVLVRSTRPCDNFLDKSRAITMTVLYRRTSFSVY